MLLDFGSNQILRPWKVESNSQKIDDHAFRCMIRRRLWLRSPKFYTAAKAEKRLIVLVFY